MGGEGPEGERGNPAINVKPVNCRLCTGVIRVIRASDQTYL